MKLIYLNRLLLPVLVATMLGGIANQSQAQQILTPTNSFVFSFSDPGTDGWFGWFGAGLGNSLMTWDGAMEGGTNIDFPGARQIVMPYNYDGVNPTNSGQAVTFGNFNRSIIPNSGNAGGQYGTDSVFNGRYFKRLTAKIRVAQDTPLRGTNNDFGNIQFNLLLSGTPNGGNNPYGANIVIPAAASNSWITITQAVDQAGISANSQAYELTGVMGIVFTKNSQGGNNTTNQYPKQPFVFWIDDVTAEFDPIAPPALPPPTLTVPVKNLLTGLSISPFAGNNNVRALIRTVGANALATWWMDNPTPVTYSMGIADMPANGNFQAHILLDPDTQNNGSPDFNDPNIIFLDIRRNANGTGFATFRCKTNQPGGNGQLYGAPPFPQPVLNTPTALGNWGVTFQNNTNVTFFGPGGVSTNFNMPPEVAEFFRPTTRMTAHFGDQNNTANQVGFNIILTNVTISSGGTNVINDNFTTVFGATQVDPAVWGRTSGGGNAGIVVLTETGWLVTWNLPDASFTPQIASNIVSWSETRIPQTVGTLRKLLIPFTQLSPTQNLFFRLEKRTPTKLVVLLPGETFAPGTLTGKTGTATNQTVNVPFNIQVIAVDSQNRRAGGLAHIIHVVGNPDSIFAPSSATLGTATMADSVANFTGQFFSEQTGVTVNADDVTAPTLIGTSSSINAVP